MLASERLMQPSQLWRGVVGDEVDFATIHSQTFGDDWLRALPPMPGFAFMALLGRMIVSAQGGTHVLQPTIQIGTIASVNNIINVSTFTAAALNNSIGAGVTKNNPQIALSVQATFPNVVLDGTIPTMTVNTAISPGTTLRARPWFLGVIVPIF